MRRITLPVDTPSFRKAEEANNQLIPSGRVVPAGTKLVVSEPLVMICDYCDQQVVYFKDDGEEFYLIVSEMGVEPVETKP